MSPLEQLSDSLWVIYAMVRGIIARYSPLPDIVYDDEETVHSDDTEG